MFFLQRRTFVFYFVNVLFMWLSVTVVYPTTEPQSDSSADAVTSSKQSCDSLLIGQYLCNETEIDPETQQAAGCDENSRLAKVWCELAPGVECAEQVTNTTFQKSVPCKWTGGDLVIAIRGEQTNKGREVGMTLKMTNHPLLQHPVTKFSNGHSFEKALLLSVFLGMFGVDRFYLGYPAIGLVKFATLGFMFLGQLVDILLIATQVVKPSDGSEYVIDYYGAAVKRIVQDNYTYLKPPDYG